MDVPTVLNWISRELEDLMDVLQVPDGREALSMAQAKILAMRETVNVAAAHQPQQVTAGKTTHPRPNKDNVGGYVRSQYALGGELNDIDHPESGQKLGLTELPEHPSECDPLHCES